MSGAGNQQSDEELAAAWGAETEGDQARAPPAQPARVLNQAEIDSLLGFDEGPGGDENRTGMQKIISSGLVSYERLPMLEIVFDRLVRIMSTSLRNFTSDNVEVGIDNILSLRFGDYLNSIPLPAMLAVFKAEEWDNYGLMVVDSAMIYSIVDVLLGGRRGTAAMRIEGRPYTTIERTLVERLIQVVLADLSASFDPLCPVTFRFERLEVNPALRHHQPPVERRRAGPAAHRHGGPWRPAGTAAALRHAGTGARAAAAAVHGREVRPGFDLGNPPRRGAVEHRGRTRSRAGRASHATGRRDEADAGVAHRAEHRSRRDGELRCGTVPLFEGRVGRRKNRVAVRIERRRRPHPAGVR